MSFSGTETNPAGMGRKLSWKLSCPVAASMASVRPWKLRRAVMMVLAPPSRRSPQRRATFTAPSLASAPELAKNVFQRVPVEPIWWPPSSVVVESIEESAAASSPRFST